MSAGLTDAEHGAMTAIADASRAVVAIIGTAGPAERDRLEVLIHVHALQTFVMAQAAARAYPDLYRLAGESLPQ